MKKLVHAHLAGWARSIVQTGGRSSESFPSGALHALIGVIVREAGHLAPEDDRLTPVSFAVGRWDDDYLTFISRGGLLNYAAWIRYRERRLELECMPQAFTSEDNDELAQLDFFLDI